MKQNKCLSCLLLLLVLFFLCCLNISLIFDETISEREIHLETQQINKKALRLNKYQSSIDTFNHSPITIVGNEELENYDVNGNGTIVNPYNIFYLKIISNSSAASINISNTNAYLEISYCILQNGASGIHLFNVSNVKILNNTFSGNKDAISLLNTEKVTIANNYMISNQIGINLLKKNSNSKILENIIVNNSFNGVTTSFSNSITISRNNISKNDMYGIYSTFSNNFTASYNNFSHNSLEAMFLNSSTNYFVIKRNNFFQNNIYGSSQSFDRGVQNTFIYNYWDEWEQIDNNDDGVIDIPYIISGEANNSDPFPQTEPNSSTSSSETKQVFFYEIPLSIIIAVLMLVASVGIVIGGTIITSKRIKNWQLSDTNQDIKTPLITTIITQIGWLTSQILYPPQVRRLSRSKVIDNPIRQKILQILKEREFEHYSSLVTQINCGFSILEWHLQVLEDFGLIKTDTFGQFKIFLLKSTKLDRFKLKIYYSIRSEKALFIVRYILEQHEKFFTVTDISKSLNMGLTTVIYHCNKLLLLGLLTKEVNTNNYTIDDKKKKYFTWLIKRHNTN